MTDTTQPHPEPSEEASILPVPRSIEGMIRGEPDAEDFGIPSEFATRAENYARWVATQSLKVAMPLTEHELRDIEAAARSALKAAPVVDVERIMALAEAYADEVNKYLTCEPNDQVAAREALRAALASPEGSPR
jgi:hypothetical protein